MSEPERILVPTDFSAAAKAAFLYALRLARRLHAEVEVLHVWEPPLLVGADTLVAGAPGGSQTLRQLAESRARAALDDFIGDVARGVHLTRRIAVGRPADAILEAAHKATMIVVATHGRAGLARLVLGSVADELVRAAPCPVVTVRVAA